MLKKCFALCAALACLLGGASAFTAANVSFHRAAPGSLRQEDAAPPAEGETLFFALNLFIADTDGRMRIELSSDGGALSFLQCAPALYYFTGEDMERVTVAAARRTRDRCEFVLAQNHFPQGYRGLAGIGFSAVNLAAEGPATVNARIAAQKPSGMGADGISVYIGNTAYLVQKQTGDAVEIAADIPGMDQTCAVYIVSAYSRGELFRIVAKNGEILGLAKRSGTGVEGLFYNRTIKMFLTKSNMFMTRRDIETVLWGLDISFLKKLTDDHFLAASAMDQTLSLTYFSEN